jgi:hypothetical protein
MKENIKTILMILLLIPVIMTVVPIIVVSYLLDTAILGKHVNE